MKKYLILVLILIGLMCTSCQQNNINCTFMENSSEMPLVISSKSQFSEIQSLDIAERILKDSSNCDSISQKLNTNDNPKFIIKKDDLSVFEENKKLYSIEQLGDFAENKNLFF